MASEDGLKSMHPLKRLFWPIMRSERSKFLPMLLIYSFIVFNYSLLKTIKDALIVTAKHSGAETIPFIKLWAILPMALVSTMIFTRLANKYTKEKVFTIMMVGFLSFFAIFAFILYPNQELLHFNTFADKMQAILPAGCKGLIAVFRNWTFTLFYVMCELWGTMIMSVLFWSFANEVTSVKEAGRFYAILGVGANIATIIAGQAGMFFCGKYLHSFFHPSMDRWSFSLMLITLVILGIGCFILVLYKWLANTITSPDECIASKKKEKPKMGLRKNFAYLAKSNYLIFIALIVLCFNIALTLIEVVWKDQVRMLCPYPADYGSYMGSVMTYIGILSTILSIFVCGQVIRRFGWTVSAYITPVILFISGVLFFIFYLGRTSDTALWIAGSIGTSPLMITTFLGSFQNCFSRASKFTFFDVTKEMAFIPLSSESKLKGKAAIDGVGSRLGKSGASLIHEALLMIFGTVAASVSYVGAILAIIFLFWVFAVRSLGKLFNQTSKQGNETSESPIPQKA
ncbi:MAG: ADP,ATP carrier protein 1 [Chlamydiia bacterium]|nr:ADP,ATP carrier protein 1 [Chlamydiia bacterium]